MNDEFDYPISATYRRWLGYEPETSDDAQEVKLIPRKTVCEMIGNVWSQKHNANVARFKVVQGRLLDYPDWVLKAQALDDLTEAIQYHSVSMYTFVDFESLRWSRNKDKNPETVFECRYTARFKCGDAYKVLVQEWRV